MLVSVGFENARTWLADVRAHADPQLTCVLVANKVDLCDADESKREVTHEEADLWAKEEKLLFLEASAKSGKNVNEVRLPAEEMRCSDTRALKFAGIRSGCS